ncbi:MAG: nicotinate-nucleotide--dimethylbenzimidazole phosphoribosyltransferase, partial [Oscillospiraceae bacterium]|nr:nicotinate-nucleotide--dimethylbenzimidazole phosphoribosyltransferase [Oscillospiraceae bacterium]
MGFISTILPADENAREAAELRWNCIAKPLGSLGALEDAITAIAALTGNAKIDIKRRAVLVMCADNGVVEEGVTQTGQEITALVGGNLLRGDTSVCKMAAVAGADVIPVDMGMITRVDGLVDCHVADGTQNFTRGPAMTR